MNFVRGLRRRARDPRLRWWVGFAIAEVLRTIALVAATAIAVAVLVHFFFEEGRGGLIAGVTRFLESAWLNRHGVPLAGPFGQALARTAPMLAAAFAITVTLSVAAGTLFARVPLADPLRFALLAVSAIPSFMLAYLFHGFVYSATTGEPHVPIWLAAGAALAIGDLNWYVVAGAFAESLARESARPHVRLLRALGRNVWLDAWPRSMVTVIEATAARVPHLLGGTIAIEMLWNIDGLGNLAWDAVVNTPPDYHAVLWVCGLGIIVSRGVQILAAAARAMLLPETILPSSPEEDEPPPYVAPSSAIEQARLEQHTTPTQLPEFTTEIPPPPGRPWKTWPGRLRYYLRLNPAHAVTLSLALCCWAATLCGLIILLTRMPSGSVPTVAPQYAPPAANLWLGADANGGDVVVQLAAGLKQQAPPLGVSLLFSLVIAPFAAAPIVVRLARGKFARLIARGTALLADGATELIESIPKLIIVLACVTLFGPPYYIFKLYLVMGLIHAPQLYRAVRDELSAVGGGVFLEGMLTIGVPLRRIARENLLRNHARHIIWIQAVLLTASIVQLDAVLGFVGVRNRGEIFTWGSMLGMGLHEVSDYAGVPNFVFNPFVLWGPLTAVWLVTVAAFTAAEFTAMLAGGRLRRAP